MILHLFEPRLRRSEAEAELRRQGAIFGCIGPLAGVLAALLTSGAVRAAPQAHVITQPDWVTMPSGEELGQAYPQPANALGLDGVTVLSCRVETSGALKGCAVTWESPAGFGFGPAALKLAPLFRMRPMTVDGAAVGDGQVSIPVNFRQPAAEAAPLPAVTPEMLALARGAIAGMPSRQHFAEEVHKPIVIPPDGETPEETRRAVEAALNAAARAHMAYVEDLPALALALVLTPNEIDAFAASVAAGSPEGLDLPIRVAIAHKLPQVEDALRAGVEAATKQIGAEARAVVCRHRICLARPAPTELSTQSRQP